MLSQTSPRPSTPGPGARALYLGARDKKQVSCTAEALVVRNNKAQTLRYPLARVARVVSSTAVDWNGSALALCMQRGISICWLDTQGNALGACYPRQRHATGLATALEVWLESPDGPLHYQQWLRSRRMDTLLRWGKAQTGSISAQDWESTKRGWVYASQHPMHLPHALRCQVLAYTASQLAAAGAVPLLWGPQAEPIHLDEDLCTLLWAEMNLATGSLADTAADEPDIIHLFESWTARNGAALMLHLNSLHRTAMKAIHE